MPDINKKYAGEGDDRSVLLEIDENSVGLNHFNALTNIIAEEMKEGVKSFKFDFSNLNSINSSGLGILIGCLKKIKDAGGTLKIINANEKIMNIFKLTKLNNVFEIQISAQQHIENNFLKKYNLHIGFPVEDFFMPK